MLKIWDVFQFNYVITHNCGCQLELQSREKFVILWNWNYRKELSTPKYPNPFVLIFYWRFSIHTAGTIKYFIFSCSTSYLKKGYSKPARVFCQNTLNLKNNLLHGTGNNNFRKTSKSREMKVNNNITMHPIQQIRRRF